MRRAYLVSTNEGYPELVFPCPTCGEGLATSAQYSGFEAYCCRCGNGLEIPDCEQGEFGVEKFGREIQHGSVLQGETVYQLDAKYLADVNEATLAEGDASVPSPSRERVEVVPPGSSDGGRRSEHNVVLSIVVNREGEISTFTQQGDQGARGGDAAASEEGKPGGKAPKRGGQKAIKTPVKSTLELAITSDGGRESAPSLTVWQAQSEQREWERLVAFGLLGLLLLVVTAFCIYLYLNGASQAAAPAKTAAANQDVPTQGVRELPISAVSPADLEEAKWVIRHYVTAANWQDRVAYVRMPERVAPLMEEYYKTNPDGLINQTSMEMTWAGYVRGHFLIVITVVDTGYREHYFTLERVGDEYKIDWEVLVEYNPMSWKEFRETRPTEPVVFRASLTADQYYNFQFSDATKFQCFRVASREEFVGLYGYANRAADWYRHIDLAPGFTRLVMIEMRYPPDAQGSNQVEITNFVRSSWVVFPEDLDKTVKAPEDKNTAGGPAGASQGSADGNKVKFTPRPSGPVMSTKDDGPAAGASGKDKAEGAAAN